MRPDRLRLRQALVGGLVLAGTVGAVLVGRLALSSRTTTPRSDARSVAGSDAVLDDPRASASSAAGPGSVIPPGDGPGAGIVVGRLIDRGTGLAVRDAGVSILELGRRSITLPDGRFRFDGVTPGAYTLVLGPAEGYVPRSLDTKVRPAGADIGIIGLIPAGAPTLLSATEGGALTACSGTRLELPAGALPEDLPVSMACLSGMDELPAPPPAGRLPLAAINLAPGAIGLIGVGQVQIALPSQPRYSAGVALDLLRLDLDRLIWRPAGSLTVAADGRSASGDILAFGDYLAAAPPFGAFAGEGEPGGPTILRLNTSVAADGRPAERVEPQTAVVYLDVAYRGLDDSLLRVRTVDEAGQLGFESAERFSGDGSQRVAMTLDAGQWPVGEYVTSVYLGEPPQIQSLTWTVGGASARPTLPAAWVSDDLGASTTTAGLPLPPVAPWQPGCAAPAGWWAYTVQAGDTLGALAMRTGSSVASLAAANCLAGDAIRAGQGLFVPSVIYKQKPPSAPGWSPPSSSPIKPPVGADPGSGSAPARTPSGQRPLPSPMPYLKATRPPDPTLAPRPALPEQPWLPPALPTSPPAAPDLPFVPPAAPPPAPVQGSGNWKEPRGPEPTLAPRPGLP
ncbi:MAG: LysM peptidoglycan-binding domain-containing protein [Ardenticatenia bacterium]|nr:LysM peptidoglycan-binding domain-containing protein [Ardenticatenia bacterium]